MTENDKVSAILEWMNTFDCVKETPLQTANDVLTTKALALIWNFINENQVPLEKLETPKNDTDWLTILKNLRVIDSVVGPILTEKKFRTQKADLTTLSRSREPQEIATFVMPYILIGMQCENRSKVIANIKKCSQKTQQFIMQYIKSSNLKPNKQKQQTVPKTPEKPANEEAKSVQSEPKKEEQESKPEEKPQESEKEKPKEIIEEKPKENVEDKNQKLREEQRIIAEKTKLIEQLRLEIQGKERKLEQLKTEKKKKPSDKSDSIQENILDTVESQIEKITNENKALKSDLTNKRAELDQSKTELAKITGIVEVLSHIRGSTKQTEEEIQRTTAAIDKIQKAVDRRPELYQEIATLKQQISDANKANEETAATITRVKNDLRTRIDIATKYETSGSASADVPVEEGDENEDIMQLVIKVNELEVKKESGVTQDMLDEQTLFKKHITKLDRLKKKMEKQSEVTAQMRNDLQRVQQELIGRRESVEEIVDTLSGQINEKNEEITHWLGLQSSMQSVKEAQPTLITTLRKKYYRQ